MKNIFKVAALAAAALTFAACGAPAGNAPASNAQSNTNANTAKPVAAAPTKEALMALEKSGWEAWKNKDAKAFDAYNQAIALARRNQSEVIGLARLAEIYAKRSQLDLGKEDVRIADRQTALDLMRQALPETSGDVEVLLSAILVYHLTNNHARTIAAFS